MANRYTNKPARSYTDEEIGRGLGALALCGGNSRKAAKMLKEQGLSIPRPTLDSWKRTREQRYREVYESLLPGIYQRIAARTDELADYLGDLEQRAAERLAEVLPNLPDRDVPGALRNISTAKAINIDKGLEARGRPTTNPDHPAYDEIVGGLRRLGLVVEGSAEEIPDGQAALPAGKS